MRYGMRILSIFIIIASYMLMLITFIVAYNHPSKTVTIGINWMGEALIEFSLLLISFPIIIYFIYHFKFNILNKLKKEML